MTDDELFLHTLQDLSQKTGMGNQYEWLRSSHLVRQLLMDGHASLVDRVNREHRLKLTFQVPEDPEIDERRTIIWMAGDSVAVGAPTPSQSVNRDGFLATRLLYAAGRYYTMHEIVDTVAHALGGVHRGDPKDPTAAQLSAINAAFPGLAGGPVFFQMRGIGHITLIGLRPLVEAVAQKRGVSITWALPGEPKVM